MHDPSPAEATADSLLELDDKARDLFVEHRRSAPVRALAWFSDLGDQPQMRMLSGAVLALGLVRADQRLLRAGTRMLLAHEVATVAKNFVKNRVDRWRPRSAPEGNAQKPRLGRSEEKEKTSFPSGHSAGALAVARAFAAEYPRYRTPALATAGVVAVAQVPRCAHYPTDVGAGLAVGAAAEAVVGLVWRLAAAALRRR